MAEERLRGTLEEGRGAVREAWGRATGQPDVEAHGQLEQIRGEARQLAAGIKETFTRSVDQVRRDPMLRDHETRRAALTLLGYLAAVLVILRAFARSARRL